MAIGLVFSLTNDLKKTTLRTKSLFVCLLDMFAQFGIYLYSIFCSDVIMELRNEKAFHHQEFPKYEQKVVSKVQ